MCTHCSVTLAHTHVSVQLVQIQYTDLQPCSHILHKLYSHNHIKFSMYIICALTVWTCTDTHTHKQTQLWHYLWQWRVDLPTERISSPFNDCRALSTQHCSLFGTQPLIILHCVKTSELFPCLNSSPPLSALYQHCFSMSLSRSLFLWLQHSAFHFPCLYPHSLFLPVSSCVSLK